LELTEVEILPGPEGAVDHENVYRRVYLKYDRNWNIIQNAVGVSQGRLEWLRQEWRQTSQRDENVLLTYPWAGDLGPLETALADKTEAVALALKLLNLYKTAHGTVKVSTKIQPFQTELWDLVRLTRPRFGLDSGELYRVMGLELDFTALEALMTLWR